MKILETRPHRYDCGIALLTGGQAGRIKDKIVTDYVRPGMAVLDVGCGTGDLAVRAAQGGAYVTGIDISEGMLSIARARVKNHHLESKVVLHHAGVVEIGQLFDENRFDLITSTLVISELYGEEREWTLKALHAILKPSGILLVAGEVRPKQFPKRMLYYTLRIPLAIITYLVSQSGTKPVRDLSGEVRRAGFEITAERYSFLGSFVIVVAKRSGVPPQSAPESATRPDQDKSPVKSLFDFCGRWFPNPVEPGLRVIGTPDRNAPVVITGNYHLTVRRVERALSGQNCYMLVAQSGGINVWCASAGHLMNTHSVITSLKTSGIDKTVDHRKIILPQLSASAINIKILKDSTGWKGIWGPAYASELPQFFANGCIKTQAQCRAYFPFSFRMEMLLSMNCLLWFFFAAIALAIHPVWALVVSIIFWGTGFSLYAGYYMLPFRSGWMKALALSVVVIAGEAFISQIVAGNPWNHAGWMLVTFLIILSIGFDLKGIVEGQTSEAEALMHKLGVDSFGNLFSARGVHKGLITQDNSICINCGTCRMVCPMGVYSLAEDQREVIISDAASCLKCKACVLQCPTGALSLRG